MEAFPYSSGTWLRTRRGSCYFSNCPDLSEWAQKRKFNEKAIFMNYYNNQKNHEILENRNSSKLFCILKFFKTHFTKSSQMFQPSFQPTYNWQGTKKINRKQGLWPYLEVVPWGSSTLCSQDISSPVQLQNIKLESGHMARSNRKHKEPLNSYETVEAAKIPQKFFGAFLAMQ